MELLLVGASLGEAVPDGGMGYNSLHTKTKVSCISFLIECGEIPHQEFQTMEGLKESYLTCLSK